MTKPRKCPQCGSHQVVVTHRWNSWEWTNGTQSYECESCGHYEIYDYKDSQKRWTD